jgi:hypothetical protein
MVALIDGSGAMKNLRQFIKDRRGATAITFALLLVPLLGFAGLAVDYSRASNDRSRLQNAADAAALAAASVFTGSNKATAEAKARAFLQANLGLKAEDINVNFNTANQKVTIGLGGQTNTLFMHVLNKDNMPISVNATALAPLKPTTAKITIDKVTGYWFKKVSIIVVRNGTEVVVGTIKYTATDHNLYNGRGGGKTDPDINTPVTFDLGDYTKLYLKMEIKNDGCDIGYKNNLSGRYVNCVVTNSSSYAKYNSTLTTDDPNTVNHLFVDGVQLPAGSKPPLDDLMNCDNATHSHAWEDGGGWADQDFFYKINAACKSVDGENVRLTH